MDVRKNKSTIFVDFNDWIEFYENVINIQGEYHKLIEFSHIYRGVYGDYDLLPMSLRKDKFEEIEKISGYWGTFSDSEAGLIKHELSILSNFFYSCNNCGLYIPQIDKLKLYMRNYKEIKYENQIFFKWLPTELFELAGLAQHYGLPTRLLDWTTDFNTALYFGISKYKEYEQYITIWIMDYSYIINTNKHRIFDELFFVDPEYYRNPNLNAQKGLLSLWQTKYPMKQETPIDRTPLNALIENRCLEYNTNLDKPILYKLRIPSSDTKRIYEYLKSNNYSAGKLFPGYQGVVRSIFDEINFEDK